LSRPASCRSTVRCAAALLALLAEVCCFAATDVRAQNPVAFAQGAVQPNGLNVQMPIDRKTSRSSGLSLSIDTRWVDNYGYRPVLVTVSSPTPATTDHQVTIRLRAGWFAQSQRRGEITVEQDLELPMGSMSAETTIACPQYQPVIQYVWWDVWVDGVRDNDLSLSRAAGWSAMIGSATSSGRCMMLVIGTASQKRQILNPGATDAEVLALPVADLPTRWIDYTCLDVVMLTFDELRQVAQANPDAFRALCRWVRAGGQLWVEEVGSEWQGLPRVDEILGLSPPPNAEGATEGAAAEAGDPAASRWQPVEFQENRRRRAQSFAQLSTGIIQWVRDPAAIDRLRNNPDFVAIDLPGDRSRDRDPDEPIDSALWYLQQPMGLGQVRAFRTPWGSQKPRISARLTMPPRPDTTGAAATAVPLTAALQTTRYWGSRHGMLPDEANRDFSNWFVPGVGLAPVTEFRVLITLFVVVIGPLNYWLLKRSQRVHLLVITVPAAAAVVTLGLFTYALLSDGLGTAVRVRSYTTLDQRTGEAVCWARLSYYAGLAPRRGLNMPSDTVVYPIVPGWHDTTDMSSVASRRELEWDNQHERLLVGWLNSRTPTQYLTIRSRQSPCRLQLTAAGDVLEATNELGTGIVYVVAVDDAGKLFAGEHIAADSSAPLMPTVRTSALARWRRFVLDNDPESPPAMSDSVLDFLRMQQRSQRQVMQQRYGRLDYSLHRLGNNLLDGAIDELAGVEGQPGLQLPPRCYLAVTNAGPEVELGIPGVTEEASFHVLVGRW
jgi:hypothetical protein